MTRRITRRRTLAGLGAGMLLPMAGMNRAAPAPTGHFRHGVASGDPDHESLVIWTRVSGAGAPLQVDWQLAEDDAFARVVSRGSLTTGPGRDYTAKVLVSGLQPGNLYYYRFHTADDTSETGRTRTLPSGDLEQLGLAVVSCSNYPFGYFNAYEAIALDEDVQWVLHLGDYLYEYGPDGYGGETGRRIGREHRPAREIVTLADYRERHAQYKSDPQSRMLHAAHPLLAIWDDHESANNPWLGGAQNHQPDVEGAWEARRRAALQAYFEWMPVRDPQPGHARSDYWRHWRFGSLASLVSLETRHSGRARQIEYADYEPQLSDRDSAQRFLREVVGAPDRDMLSPEMQRFAATALADAVTAQRPWRLLANQIPMARTHHPALPASRVQEIAAELPNTAATRLRRLARMGELDLPLYLDPWDGYPWARQAFYEMCQAQGVSDLLVLTGDSHSFWLNELFDDAGHAMGLELGTTGISSPGDFIELGARGARFMDEQLAAGNREVLWTDGRHNGYLRLTLRPESAHADYLAVSGILDRDYRVLPLKRAVIGRAEGQLRLKSG
jgi:alkaline phosphatase D